MTPHRIVFSLTAPKTRKGLIPVELVRRAGAHKNHKNPGRSFARQGFRKDLDTRLNDFS